MEIKMIKRYDFVDKTLAIIRKELENNLPKEGTLDEMVEKRNELLKRVMHMEVR